MPAKGETVTLTASVKNTGFEPAGSIIVRFYQGDPSTGSGQQIGADQAILSLASGQFRIITMTARTECKRATEGISRREGAQV